MKKPKLKDDPEHWRRRARESRAIADQLEDLEAKRTMLEIAEGYMQLAALADRRASK